METIKHVLVNRFQGNSYAPAMGGFSPTVALSKEDVAQLLLNNHCCRSLGNNSQGTREALEVLFSSLPEVQQSEMTEEQHKPK